MANVINLRQVRKTKLRAQQAAAADANRLAFGRSKAEKAATARDITKAERLHEAHRREMPVGDA